MYHLLSAILAFGTAFMIGGKILFICTLSVYIAFFVTFRLFEVRPIKSPFAFYVWSVSLGTLSEQISVWEADTGNVFMDYIASAISLSVILFWGHLPHGIRRILTAVGVFLLFLCRSFLYNDGIQTELHAVQNSLWIAILFSGIGIFMKRPIKK